MPEEDFDDALDGCDVDFGEDPTPDEHVPYVALFAGAETPEEIAELEDQYRQLAGMPAPES